MVKKILITMGVILLILAGVLLLNYYPMLLMKPLETGAVTGTDIVAIKDNSNNVFVLESNDGYIVIDAGTSLKGVRASLEELAIDPKQVTHLFLTHTDMDHVGAVPLFENAQIYLGDLEQAMIDGSTKRNMMQYNKLPDGTDQNDVTYLADESEVQVGEIKVKCFATPGHTSGSVSYLIDDKYLFTGDAVQVKDDQLVIHPFTMDEETAQKSIDRIVAIAGEEVMLFTAHYGYVK